MLAKVRQKCNIITLSSDSYTTSTISWSLSQHLRSWRTSTITSLENSHFY